MKNMHSYDQLMRMLAGVVLLEAAIFWLAGTAQWLALGCGALLLVTGVSRFCPVYRLLGIGAGSSAAQPRSGVASAVSVVLLLAALAGGSYASVFFSRKVFLEELNAMNNFYKQTLFLTGKGQREAANANYDKLLPAYLLFKEKYTHYQPYALRGDAQLVPDLDRVHTLLKDVNGLVRNGDLHQAHLDLEKVRPVFQDIFKRNGFSLLSVALVDFHDTMELMLEAGNAKDIQRTVGLYPQVNDKLLAVEAEANDADIQAIRKNLEAMATLARDNASDKLPAQAEALKSSFIKVYLQRG
jgi:hypothetical protein